jgi:hypothetical protein
MKYTILLFSLLFVCSLSAQEYKTYKKVNDSTYLETRSFEEEDAVQLSEDAVLSAFFREMDRWARIENRHFNNLLAAQRVFGALNRDQKALIPDTTYNDYNSFRDTLYSLPALDTLFESELITPDSSYQIQLYRNNSNAQVIRLEGGGASETFQARFVASTYAIRLGTDAKPIPGLMYSIVLHKTNETQRFVVYEYEAPQGFIKLRIRKR